MVNEAPLVRQQHTPVRRHSQGVAGRIFQHAVALALVWGSGTPVAAQSRSADLAVSVTVARSCSLEGQAVASIEGRGWVPCEQPGHPPARVDATAFPSGDAPAIQTATAPGPCAACRMLVVNF